MNVSVIYSWTIESIWTMAILRAAVIVNSAIAFSHLDRYLSFRRQPRQRPSTAVNHNSPVHVVTVPTGVILVRRDVIGVPSVLQGSLSASLRLRSLCCPHV